MLKSCSVIRVCPAADHYSIISKIVGRNLTDVALGDEAIIAKRSEHV